MWTLHHVRIHNTYFIIIILFFIFFIRKADKGYLPITVIYNK